ncbi:CHAT domain-containing protein [Lactarius psammicola]|nr:CHAT domain-containing protein [Lactarius psammicola]
MKTAVGMADVPGSIHDIGSFVAHSQQFLSLSSQYDPLRLSSVIGLAITRLEQHVLSNQREDLDKSILHLTESILLPPRSWTEHPLMILQALFLLAFALLRRSKGLNQPEDATYAAKYLRHLRSHPELGFPRHAVTTLLVDVLAFQVELGARKLAQNIEEMAVLCHELFTSGASDGDTTRSITLFARVVSSKICLGVPNQPLDIPIECLRAARKYKPDLHAALFALGHCLGCRYCTTLVNDDYEEAASALDEITTSSPETVRAHHNPEYSEEAIYRARTFLASSPVKGPFHSAVAFDLEGIAKQRFHYFGSIEGLEARSSTSPLSLSQLVLAFVGYEDDNSEVDRIIEEIRFLEVLLYGIRNHAITKIDGAVEMGRSILASFAPRHPLASFLFDSFGEILFEAFERTNKIEYFNELISTRRQVIERRIPEFLRFMALGQLSLSLLARFVSFPNELVKLLSCCADDGRASLPDRFQLACEWASFARLTEHPSVSTAYESAVSLMQETLIFGPTLQLQHAILATTSHESHNLPLDYASYQVDSHQLEEAIETLERGRALLWSEMRHLRASIDQLLQADPQLGHEFDVINRELDKLTKSIPPSHKLSMDGGAADDLMVDPFGRLLLKQRRLLKERDNLLSQIQILPGLDIFLTSPSFDTLRSAASSGPVIIINHSIWRSDILILLHNTSPSLIPTPHDFYDRASALKDELLDARNKCGPNSDHYNQTLSYVLSELYNLVGKPVIDRLHQLRIPEQSRVWWCPTSVFCSLPLHAMGPVQSDDGCDERYFSDLYITSYTPTLSVLIPAAHGCELGSPTLGPPSLLLVAHFDVPSPDVSLSEVCEDIKVVQALTTQLPVKSLISEGATGTSVLDGLQVHRFVHFICHGTLEAGKPFDAGFELHGNERLTLLDIVRSRLPAAEFAFLSACHTAELTDGSSAEEGLHLAAAVQYCGFRSVVGTMWAMANEDGPDLAKHFYKSMFPRGEQGKPVPYYKRSARALRDAVKKLRKKRHMTLERWVNFVHYGA